MFFQEVLYVLYVPFKNKNTVSDRATSTKFRRTLTTIILPLKKACDAGLISSSHIGFRRQNDE